METAEKPLSPRLRQISELRQRGRSNQQIADELGLCKQTVENYITKINNGGWSYFGSHATNLSKRQEQLREHLESGKTNKEIAAALNLSAGTVKVYLHKLTRKTGLNRHELALSAKQELVDELEFIRVFLMQRVRDLERELSEWKAKIQGLSVED